MLFFNIIIFLLVKRFSIFRIPLKNTILEDLQITRSFQ